MYVNYVILLVDTNFTFYYGENPDLPVYCAIDRMLSGERAGEYTIYDCACVGVVVTHVYSNVL